MKKKLVVIGGGFAGISAARTLARVGKSTDCTVIDRKDCLEFLPLLPDVVGGRIRPDFLRAFLPDICRGLGLNFRRDEVLGIDPSNREILTGQGTVAYDYLLIACGSETNFYDNTAVRDHACKLDNLDDAGRIASIVNRDTRETYVIAGGGYTGVEVAANIRRNLDRAGRKRRILVVESGPSLLAPLPKWIRDYAAASLRELHIESVTNSRVTGVDKNAVTLSGGERLSGALLIWTAGVKTPDFVQKMTREKTGQGRIRVDKCLRADRFCFLAGDAANVDYAGGSLRMSIQFALSEGQCAAANIVRDISGVRLQEYRPFDPGYVLPMAANRACGKAFNIPVRGRTAFMLHYLMSLYRSYGIKNKFGIISDLLTGRLR